jgi:RNA polymerase sigma-70 factor (ECF subfamily)
MNARAAAIDLRRSRAFGGVAFATPPKQARSRPRVLRSWDTAERARVDQLSEPAADAALVELAGAGDRQAFEQLVIRHADRLHAVVRFLVDTDQDAEDVTQEAFLRAWRAIGNFKGDSQFFTWLCRIGINEANRRRARSSGRGRTASLDANPIEPADERPGPARALEHDDLRRALEAAVRSLSPDHRAPLVLRDIEGFSTAQAAELLGLGEAAFKSRLHRARLTVRDAIRDYLPEDAA